MRLRGAPLPRSHATQRGLSFITGIDLPVDGGAVAVGDASCFLHDYDLRRPEKYGLSDRQSADASDRAVDSRVVLVRTNDRLQHFWRRTC